MKRFILLAAFTLLTVVFLTNKVFAGPPFNNLEGVGGVAFNPLAYLADSDGEDSHLKIGEKDIIGKPRFGVGRFKLLMQQLSEFLMRCIEAKDFPWTVV